MILSIASPQSVHLVGHIAQMPTALGPVSSSARFSTLIDQMFGENLDNLLIS